ncbi:XRE family transcriptional regulator [Rhizobium ruizarguesonis]|nr:LexA family transcriptional regulator [Rhizobium ruizarguesonis]
MDVLHLNPSSTANKAGLDRATVRKLLENDDQVPKLPTIQKLAEALETTELWLLSEQGSQPSIRSSELRAASATLPAGYEMPKDVPVMGTAAGSHLKGAFQLHMDPVDYVRRPPTLIHARNIYSLYVEGESMVPQFSPADLLFINPDKPVRVGDAVVIQVQVSPEGGYEATLGVFLKRNSEWITIQKHNPKAEIQIARSTVLHMHKVLTPNEIYGV